MLMATSYFLAAVLLSATDKTLVAVAIRGLNGIIRNGWNFIFRAATII
ncbi:hypothetical protein [Brenneria goodwinii]|nr:hypothetical protein [Brenneria goodwinii]MCG8167229.1 hypothetical protein [Brenneria goodwinii]MCG8176667.1 hypothetical protein [Brenneria goodwinii]MCG8181285.1 hypothetical protein [Brenneria goodwinii]